jgi:hypothetical protein
MILFMQWVRDICPWRRMSHEQKVTFTPSFFVNRSATPGGSLLPGRQLDVVLLLPICVDGEMLDLRADGRHGRTENLTSHI